MRETEIRRPGAGGFTLIEVLIGIVLLGLIAVAVAAISLPGVLRISGDNQERQLDATTAQWVSIKFARDVQGAAKLVDECSDEQDDPNTEQLVTFSPSDGSSPVEYRQSVAQPVALERLVCGSGAPETVVQGLASIKCDDSEGDDCAAGSPRSVKLLISRTDSEGGAFEFELDGVRRPTGGTLPASAGAPDFFALGGDKPLRVQGNATLIVEGSAYVNEQDEGAAEGFGAVTVGGNAYFDVTGEFLLQEGASCKGCDFPSRVSMQPPYPTFPQWLPDPLRFLPEPVPAQNALVRSACPLESAVIGGETVYGNICQPGIYEGPFPPNAGSNQGGGGGNQGGGGGNQGGGGGNQGGGGDEPGSTDFYLVPGMYFLQAGLSMQNGSLTGDDVLLFVESGSVSVTGGDFRLRAETNPSKLYAGILLFQSRSINERSSSGITFNGNGTVTSIAGTIYAPASIGVTLGNGKSELRIGRVIGASLTVSGTGTESVIVTGSSGSNGG